MSIIQDNIEKRRPYTEYRDEIVTKSRRINTGAMSPKNGHNQVESEKRIRREIANSNERRRMQSINAGFETLRALLPPVQDGEKLSKATILQMTAKYISTLMARVNSLENEVTQLRSPRLYSQVVEESETILPRKRKPDDSRLPPSESCKPCQGMEDLDPNPAEYGVFLHLKPDYEQYAVEPQAPMAADTRPAFTTVPVATFLPQSQLSQPQHTSPLLPACSPRPESSSSTAARLEHLVMAIEQIEGRKVLSYPPKQDMALPSCIELPGQESRQVYHAAPPPPAMPLTSTHNTVIKPVISPYTEQIDELIAASQPNSHSSEGKALSSMLLYSEKGPGCPTSAAEEYPIVTKLLNRPIPHKYLHRPQVVVNSSH